MLGEGTRCITVPAMFHDSAAFEGIVLEFFPQYHLRHIAPDNGGVIHFVSEPVLTDTELEQLRLSIWMRYEHLSGKKAEGTKR